jgi:hypothetical protein
VPFGVGRVCSVANSGGRKTTSIIVICVLCGPRSSEWQIEEKVRQGSRHVYIMGSCVMLI